MKISKINYFAVGIFIILMGAGVIGAIAMLAGRTGATDTYFAIYRNVTGLTFGSQVFYEGYPIGQVEEITPEEQKGRMVFRVDFSVIEGWRIPSDSVAQIASAGLLSAISINIRAGLAETPVAPGEEVLGQESADLFAAVSSVANEIGSLAEYSVKPLLNNIGEAVDLMTKLLAEDGQALARDSREMIADSRDMIGSLKTVVADVAASAPEVLKNIEKSTVNFSQLSGDLHATRAKLDELIGSLDEVAGTMDAVVTDNRAAIEESVQDLRYIVDSVARHVDSVNQNMEGTARNMYEFSRQIRQNPGLLLGGTPPKDAAAGQ